MNISKKRYGKKIEIVFHRYWQLGVWNYKNVYEKFSTNKDMFDFWNYSANPEYYDDPNALVAGKVKDEMGVVAIEEFV